MTPSESPTRGGSDENVATVDGVFSGAWLRSQPYADYYAELDGNSELDCHAIAIGYVFVHVDTYAVSFSHADTNGYADAYVYADVHVLAYKVAFVHRVTDFDHYADVHGEPDHHADVDDKPHVHDKPHRVAHDNAEPDY